MSLRLGFFVAGFGFARFAATLACAAFARPTSCLGLLGVAFPRSRRCTVGWLGRVCGGRSSSSSSSRSFVGWLGFVGVVGRSRRSFVRGGWLHFLGVFLVATSGGEHGRGPENGKRRGDRLEIHGRETTRGPQVSVDRCTGGGKDCAILVNERLALRGTRLCSWGDVLKRPHQRAWRWCGSLLRRQAVSPAGVGVEFVYSGWIGSGGTRICTVSSSRSMQ